MAALRLGPYNLRRAQDLELKGVNSLQKKTVFQRRKIVPNTKKLAPSSQFQEPTDNTQEPTDNTQEPTVTDNAQEL